MEQFDSPAANTGTRTVAENPIDNGEHDEELQKQLDEARKHGDEVVARDLSGKNHYAQTYAELFRLLDQAGLRPQDMEVIEYVLPLDSSRIF